MKLYTPEQLANKLGITEGESFNEAQKRGLHIIPTMHGYRIIELTNKEIEIKYRALKAQEYLNGVAKNGIVSF